MLVLVCNQLRLGRTDACPQIKQKEGMTSLAQKKSHELKLHRSIRDVMTRDIAVWNVSSQERRLLLCELSRTHVLGKVEPLCCLKHFDSTALHIQATSI